jgi:hypothetical protein
MKATGEVIALQLSAEHNVSIESVRQEMHSLHHLAPGEPSPKNRAKQKKKSKSINGFSAASASEGYNSRRQWGWEDVLDESVCESKIQ